MHRLLVCFFIAIFFMGTTPVLELMKVPELMRHFEEHKHENKNLGLLEFISIHYLHGNLPDEDYEKDMKLPFKKYNGAVSQVYISNPHAFVLSVEEVFYADQTQDEKIFTEEHLQSQYLSRIWQPPRQS